MRRQPAEERPTINSPADAAALVQSEMALLEKEHLRVLLLDRRNRVLEYLVWRTAERRFDWFLLEDEEYRSQTPDADGLLQSRVFPGLRLPVEAVLSLDAARVLAALT